MMTTQGLSPMSPSFKITVASILFLGIPLVGWSFYSFGPAFGFVLLPVTIASYLGHRMHLARFDQKTQEISEASRLHLATVEALATAIDARDQVGAGHVRRTQIFAVGLGRLLGLPESDIDALRTGALLHDIGKLAIPDHILNKPEQLTPAELEKTKIHPKVGASILEKIGFTTPVVPTIRHHHESWDGSGYPDGLVGDRIPLTARILAVADGFDTLRGARPYRAALTREKARQIVQAEAGTRFDPTIVGVLMQNLASLEAEIDAAGLSYTDSDMVSTTVSNGNYVEQIKRANREVFSLYEMAREFSSAVDLEETLDLFAKKVGELLPFTTCSLYILTAGGQFATAAHVEGENRELLIGRRVKVGQGASGYALKVRENVKNVDPDLDFAYSQVDLTGQYRTMASVPLIAEDEQELVGTVTVYSKDLAEYGDEHIRILETISRIAAEAIGKSLKHTEATTNAMTDPMTGLPNARSLQIQFEKEVARASRGGNNFQLLMLDLDGFKAVNDSYGHKAGDEMLREVSRVINEQLRDYDFLARYGGDEFVALVPETAPEDVIDLCSRIEAAVHSFELNVGNGKTASVGVSLGSSGYPVHGQTFDQMIVAADKIMYERKQERKRYAITHNVGPAPRVSQLPEYELFADLPTLGESDGSHLIVELDERHIVSNSIN
ncbi:MAG: diguanylate cyclase [Pyrinomonadaceae bacterium]|nr:diguanylate cyclase [Pyrinomonadaceae bacterium]